MEALERSFLSMPFACAIKVVRHCIRVHTFSLYSHRSRAERWREFDPELKKQQQAVQPAVLKWRPSPNATTPGPGGTT